MMTSLAPPRSRTLLLLPIVWIAGLFPAREAGALSLLCTNRPTVTQDAVATVAELLALDGSAIIVFSDDLDIPADRFESAFIIEVLDRPGISPRAAGSSWASTATSSRRSPTASDPGSGRCMSPSPGCQGDPSSPWARRFRHRIDRSSWKSPKKAERSGCCSRS
jgi:hypothetical protein